MDELDQRIINLLAENARISYTEIASKVGLSSPAVKMRIIRMEEKGIIRGYRLALNYEALGYLVTAYIQAEVDKENRDSFLNYVRECPNVVECDGITGDAFAIMKVRFRSTMELDHFLNDLQRFGETSTNIVLSPYRE